MRSRRLFAVLVAVALAIVVATQAGATQVYSASVFGSAAQPSFTTATALAVDQSNGDVLVMDAGTSTVSRWKSDGTPANFSALGTNTIDGKGSGLGPGSGHTCTPPSVECDETPQGGLTLPGAASQAQIAVDDSGGVANGDIYVTTQSPTAITIFSSGGEYLGQLTDFKRGPKAEGEEGQTSVLWRACGVAVDPSGAVYVGDEREGIHKYVPSANPPVNTDNKANYASVENPCALAAGAGPTAGSLFVAKFKGPTYKLDSSSGELEYTVSPEIYTTIGVNPASGHVFGALGKAVKEWDAHGASAAVPVASSYEAASTLEGLAVDKGGDVYVSRSGQAHAEVFGATAPVTFPTVSSEAASATTNTETTLNGGVDPEGAEVTECKFEWGETTTPYANSALCSPAAPFTSKTAVSAHLTGLTPEKTYHFRLVAKNVNGHTSLGADLTVKIPSTAVTAAASELTNTQAMLNGTVFPEASPATECKFEYATERAFHHIQTLTLVKLESFQLEFEGQKTSAQSSGVSAAALQTALTKLSTIGAGNAVVSGASPTWTVEFTGALASVALPALSFVPKASGPPGTVEGNWSGAPTTVCSPAPPYASKTAVSAQLAALTAETTYHFRLMVKNAAAKVWKGAGEVLTTLGPPHISNVQITAAGTTTVSLSALIDPNGGSTTYRVIYGTTSSYGQSTLESEPVGSDQAQHAVTAGLSGLQPGMTYHFRFVATNPYGSERSADAEVRTYVVESGEAGCPNEARRIEQASTFLPECRAYEMVTPPDKGSGGAPQPSPIPGYEEAREIEEPLKLAQLQGVYGAQASLDGNRMAWGSEPLPNEAGSSGISHLATRGASGWTSQNLVPRLSPDNDLLCPLLRGVTAWSPDLSRSILDLPAGPPTVNSEGKAFTLEPDCGHDEPRLVPGGPEYEPEHFRNLFLHDNTGGSNQLVNVTPAGVTWPERTETGSSEYWPASFLAGSDDLSHVVFEEELPLTSNAPGAPAWEGYDNVYEWANGEVRLVTILPNGNAVQGSLAGATRNYSPAPGTQTTANIAWFRHAVSASGSRTFFEAEVGGKKNLYVRLNPSAEPTASGECSATEPEKACTVQIDAAEAGAPGPSGGGKFEIANAAGSRVFFIDANKLTADSTAVSGKPDLYEYDLGSGKLTDLTVDTAEPASVLGVSGASEDASYLYFVAKGGLTSQPNSQGESAIIGKPNLYLTRAGAISFVATLDPADECDWTWNALCNVDIGLSPGLTARTSDNGLYLGFNSRRSLTGYDNTGPNGGEARLEIYLYDAATSKLSCASCIPSGARPRFGAGIAPPVGSLKTGGSVNNRYPQRNVSNNGQVFFETTDALLPSDVNGRRDVYEYANGTVRLLSTGTSKTGTHFLDATPNGSDVFISTAQPLVGSDADTVYDYYDVHVDGGFASQSGSVAPPPCGAVEACRSPLSEPPAEFSPASSTLTGAGNLPPSSVESKAKPKPLTRAQKLARALKACRKQRQRKQRAACERRARKLYGAKTKAKKTARGGK